MMFDYIFIADYAAAARYFIRVMKELDGASVLITNIYSMGLEASAAGQKHILFNKRKSESCPASTSVNTREYVSGQLGKMQAKRYADIVYGNVLNSGKLSQKTKIVCWNGSDIIGEVLRVIQDRCGVLVYFMEISNIPGKLVVDTNGVNARSSICEDGFSFPRVNVSDEKAKLLFDDILNKKKSYVPPQSLNARRLNLRMFFDYSYMFMAGISNFSFSAALRKLLNKLFITRMCNVGTSEFAGDCFFPMQVATDSQILLNSDFDVNTALVYVVKKYPGMVVVKPHPAEMDRSINTILREYAERGEIILYSGSIELALESCNKVVTINSTVGLEALLMGKNVEFIGRSQYALLDTNSKLYWYLKYYLIDGDFFDDDYSVSGVVKALS